MQKSILDKSGNSLALAHTRSHSITGTSDHTSAATSGKMLKADANGLPVDATNTDTEVAAAVVSMIMKNRQETNANHTLASGYNGTVLGPWTVGNGYTFTITDGSRFMVLND